MIKYYFTRICDLLFSLILSPANNNIGQPHHTEHKTFLKSHFLEAELLILCKITFKKNKNLFSVSIRLLSTQLLAEETFTKYGRDKK